MGAETTTVMYDLTESNNYKSGFIWKIWAEDRQKQPNLLVRIKSLIIFNSLAIYMIIIFNLANMISFKI